MGLGGFRWDHMWSGGVTWSQVGSLGVWYCQMGSGGQLWLVAVGRSRPDWVRLGIVRIR